MTVSLEFVKQKFREYYASIAPEAIAPSDCAAREFGAGWIKKIDWRHLAFANAFELKSFLMREAPLFVSYSAAHYEMPAAQPMERKNARAWDLIFDIDAPTLRAEHEHDELFCEKCFDAVQSDAQRLIDEFLIADFGFSEKEVSVNFSGSKGLHIHVASEEALRLSQDARKQIAAFVKGPRDASALLVQYDERAPLRGPSETAKGWKGRAYRAAREFLEKASVEDLRDYGLRKDRAQRIVAERETALSRLAEGYWNPVAGLEKIWPSFIGGVIARSRVEIDEPVTTDAARLIRLPESLHGGSSLRAAKISLKKLAEFEPLRDAVAFRGDEKVRIKTNKKSEFEFAGEQVEVREGESEVALGPALFLLCKDEASLA
ncbi:MAG: DNA primase catalytic subunit PriS [Candidatus Norongarragalinales archaeon]